VDKIHDIDLGLISHNHYDHLDKKTIKKLAKGDMQFIVPLGVGKHLKSWGVKANRITELDWWENSKLDDLTLTATPAQHFSGRWLIDNNKTLWASWSITGKSHSVFFSADTLGHV
jgi:L-ascorbate metabolism protein UlaG (beta-lactamase superfamily)